MLARGHRVQVSEGSTVGCVIRTGNSRLVVAESAVFSDSLDLPGTRSQMALPLRARGEMLGALDVQSTEPKAFSDEDVAVLQTLADTLAIAIQQARLFESVRQQGEQLRALAARLAEAEEVERQRVARDLHDLVGQNLNALGINLNLLRKHVPEGTTELVRSRLDDSLALVQETSAGIRRVMDALRPPMLDDFGLVATLHWYGARFASRTGIAVTVQGEEPVPRLAAPVENALFRIVQEGLTNVAKHAQATQVTVTVAADDGGVRLVVADDGVGFDPVHRAPPDGRRGWGLMTMVERAVAVGGRCRIESQPRQGTRVIVEVAP
jgi:signal transduction histidine kinase